MADSDNYFNDLSQQPTRTDESQRRSSQEGSDNDQAPKPHKIACILCRRRKLRCNGEKPSCGTCKRLKHDCSYDEVRKKSGPKRGYVKALEARLAQVETLLKTQDEPATTSHKGSNDARTSAEPNGMTSEFGNVVTGGSNANLLPHLQSTRGEHDFPAQAEFPHSTLGTAATGNMGTTVEEPFPWEMIGLGLDEPLPTQDVVDDLNQLYFDKVHLSVPMIHRSRYYAAMNLAPHMRPPVCLRYAMWASAAAISDKYEGLQEHFYQRARKYIQQDEMKGHGESMITVAHCQTWVLLGTLEFKLMYFPRAWMSSGRASRMALMMGLHRLDGTGLDVKQCVPPPKDWTEREERRRTFWMSFCVDRYASIGTGWPMSIEERDIKTALPTDEDGYDYSRPAKTMHLAEALEPSGPPHLAPFAGVILMACLFGRNLTHLHRPGLDDQDDDLNGEFWRRHRGMDNVLLNTALALPDPLRLPSGLNSPNIVFLNMNVHTSTICLHQAAIFKADKNQMPARVSAESKVRCITAAAEIASIMRQVSHLDLSTMNPFISFCLYVAARVFVQYLKSRPKDAQVKASLQFLLSAMHALKRKNPLTESFLVQLDVDLETAGLEDSHQLRMQMHKQNKPNGPNRSPGCPQGHLGNVALDGTESRATYGDSGLAAYNQPTQSIVEPVSGSNGTYTHISGASNFELPNRQRTPGSNSSGLYQSPNNPAFNSEMDTSPDGSNNGQQTPGSSNQSHHNASSHTSNTAYSPNNQPEGAVNNMQLDPATVAAMLDPNDPSFAAGFDLSSFPASMDQPQQAGFVVPTGWATGSTGMTPASTGFTPGSSNAALGMEGMMSSMTDADWTQMMETFNADEWNSGMEHPGSVQEIMSRTR